MELLQVEMEWMGRPNKEKVLRSLLRELKVEYDFTVIDTPPGLGLMAVNALMAAHSLPVPLQCEFYAVEGLRPYLRFVDLLKRSLHPAIHPYRHTRLSGSTRRFEILEGFCCRVVVSGDSLWHWSLYPIRPIDFFWEQA
jgi:cellulose biosynthesis protein BcsQ